MPNPKDERRHRIKVTLIVGVYFICISAILFKELASPEYFLGLPIGVILAFIVLYDANLKLGKQYKSHSRYPPRNQIGLGGALLLTLVIVFGVPGLDTANGSIKSLFAGFGTSFLVLLCFGSALIYYWHK